MSAPDAPIIDLRSDTVTRPDAAMRSVIAAAEVGDDVLREDPTVRALEAEVAGLLGHEDAVFVATGTLSNQIALRAWTEPGDIFLCEAAAHIHLYESGAPYALAGLTPRLITGQRGLFDAETAARAIAQADTMPLAHLAQPVKLLAIENTHNAGGGAVWPVEALDALAQTVQARGLRLHCDGARLWNAAVALEVEPARIAVQCDSVSVCFSKGLGAPMGSALAGPRPFIARARRFKQQYGGGFRQAGMMAAAARYALAHNRERLADDHVRARRLAQGLADLPGLIVDPATVETNILRLRVTAMSAQAFARQLAAAGVRVYAFGADGIRCVTHLEIDDAMISRAITAAAAILRAP